MSNWVRLKIMGKDHVNTEFLINKSAAAQRQSMTRKSDGKIRRISFREKNEMLVLKVSKIILFKTDQTQSF